MSRFVNLSDKNDFPGEEEKVLSYWQEINAFHTSIELSVG